MNTTSSASSRRVILAGISEDRLDLFLLLNEGAGYEVTGVIDTRGAGESSRIAEILGVPVLDNENADPLPDADLLIYGDERFLPMGDRLHLDKSSVWHENDAWRILTEGDEEPAATNGEASPGDQAVARAAIDWEREEREPTEAPPPAAGEPESSTGASPASGEAAAQGGDTGPAGDTVPPVGPIPSVAPPPASRPGVTSGAFAMLHDFAVASGDLETLYKWILGRALEMAGAAAGGIRPGEPIRPYAWSDRRRAARHELPDFLRGNGHGPGVSSLPLGGPETPGGGHVQLVGRISEEARGEIRAFLDAVAPALRTVAELEDHRRERATDEVIGRLSDELRSAEGSDLGDALAETCRALAESLRARECMLLFTSSDGEVVRGYSSGGQRVVAPARSGLFGAGGDDDTPRRLTDEQGRWHYHVPFRRGDRRGALALFGVPAEAGSVEALACQAAGLARTLAERLPEAAWQT